MILLDINIGMVTHSLHESTLYLCSCVIGMVKNAEFRVTALTVQVKSSVFFLVEVHTPVHKFHNLLRSITHHLLHCLAIGDIVTCDNRVGNMLIKSVEFHIRHTCHTALCKRCVCLIKRCLANHTHLTFVGTCHFQSVTHACNTCSYNQEIIFVYHISSKLCCKDNKKFRE